MKVNDRTLDHLRVDVLRDERGGSLFGMILIQLDLKLDEKCPTACITPKRISLNPELLESLKPEVQKTLIIHELQHIARMHMSRRGNRNHRVWNMACDYVINNTMVDEGYSFEGLEFGCFNTDYSGMTEETIYELLIQEEQTNPSEPDPYADMEPTEDESDSLWDVMAAQNAVIRSGESLSGIPGLSTDMIKELIDKLTTPQVNWKHVLQKKLLDYGDELRSYSRRKRGCPDMLLPGIIKNPEGSLISFTAYVDTSGSVSSAMASQIISELFAIKQMSPEVVIRMVQFDVQINQDYLISTEAELINTEFVGRGGTDLECVVEDIVKTKPNFAIIFSDLRAMPVDLSNVTSDLIWIIIGDYPTYHPDKGTKWSIRAE